MESNARQHENRWVLTSLILCHIMMLSYSASIHSPTSDEVAHLAAGLRSLRNGEFDLYRVNPPLVKSVAALPLLLTEYETDWTHFRPEPTERCEWTVGHDFAVANGERIFWLVTLGRWFCMPFSIMGLVVSYFFGTNLSGRFSGLCAAALWTFSPNVLGHGALLTPDIPAAALSMTTIYLFWRWLQEHTPKLLLGTGLLLGLALLTKFTCLIILALTLPLLFLYRPGNKYVGLGARLLSLLLIWVIATVTVNLGYGFRGTFTRLDEYDFVSSGLTGRQNVSDTPNRFHGTWIGRIPVPIPKDYVLGIDIQKKDFEKCKWSFLCGEYKRGGWWHYYAICALVKMPVSTLALIAASTLSMFRTSRPHETRGSVGILLLPALAIFVVVSANTGLNRHFRYVAISLPFLFVWLAGFAKRMGDSPKWRLLLLLGVSLSAGSSVAALPHSLSYFNEAIGGANGHRWLLHSNVDWGQNLLLLNAWSDTIPMDDSLYVVYDGPIPPELLGLKSARPSDQHLKSGKSVWYAISVGKMTAPQSNLRHFLKERPAEVIGNTIYIYRVSHDFNRQCHVSSE